MTALWYVAPGKAELRPSACPAPGPGEVEVRTLYSLLSRGTERLVLNGLVPKSEYRRMRAPAQEGEFPFPVKYGYAAVGTVEAGPAALKGRTVFALHPHQDRFVLPAEAVVAVPDAVPARRAVLAANIETALNVTWDADLAPGARVTVVGGGLIGLLTAYVAARTPGTEVTVVDKDRARAALAQRLGVGFATPDAAPRGARIVVHASASDAGLALALEVAGFEATVVEASWYGDRPVSVPLGGAFHSQRLRLVSSQVGAVAPSHRGAYTPRRRLETAIGLLADDRLDALLGEDVPFAQLPRELPRLLAPDAPGVGALVRY